MTGLHQGVKQPAGFPPLPENWVSEWETFPNSEGNVTLFAATHIKPGVQKGGTRGVRALVVLHGFGEHGGRYLHLPHFLQNEFDVFFVMDHQGHGRSQGPRGHIERFDVMVDDAAAIVRRVADRFAREYGKSSEVHVLGHSMGGLIALRMGFLYPDLPVRSYVISAPFLGIRTEVSLAKRAAAIVLSRLWGSLALGATFDPNVLSRDKNVVDAYVLDRLVHGKMTPKFYMQVQAAMDDTLKRRSGLKPPMLLLVPLDDQLVNQSLTLGFYETLEHDRKRVVQYEGFRHEILNEHGKEQVFEEISNWVRQNTSRPA